MQTFTINLEKYHRLWKNLVTDIMYPVTRNDYLQFNEEKQAKFCDELHEKLESSFGFKILYSGDNPSRMLARYLEFSDIQKAENFVNNAIPMYTNKSFK